MRIFGTTNVDGATDSPPLIGAAFPVLLTLEDREDIGESPALGSVRRPTVVVALHAARPHHGVDAAAATEYMTESHVERAIVQTRRRLDRQMVIERPADVVKPDARVRDGRRVIRSSRLDHQDLRA